MSRLLRIAMNVRDLDTTARFYRDALGFRQLTATRLTLGAQEIELTPTRGAAYPSGSTACDLWFQHFAIITTDMAASYARLGDATPITLGEPVRLPPGSGGVTCYKFRDPDGHPLELIAGTTPRIDHSAISVADIDASIAFYTSLLGLKPGRRQCNIGPEQDKLDGLTNTTVDVIPMLPEGTPHLELLRYRSPIGRPSHTRPTDIAATRLIFETAGPSHHITDPDGHIIEKKGQGSALDPLKAEP